MSTYYFKGGWGGHRFFLVSTLSCHFKRCSGKASWGPGPGLAAQAPRCAGEGVSRPSVQCQAAARGSCFLVPARGTCVTAGPTPIFLLSLYFLAFSIFVFFPVLVLI